MQKKMVLLENSFGKVAIKKNIAIGPSMISKPIEIVQVPLH